MSKVRYEAPIFVGIDGGGTKCRAVVFDSEFNELGSAITGPANIAKYGETAVKSMYDAVEQALLSIGLKLEQEQHRLYVSAGLAGVNVPSAAAALREWHHPFARFDFTTDIHAALLGAHSMANGAVLIAGTGSCAAGLKDGVVKQFGGHGFTLGDKGSGAWLGRTALAHTLESLDELSPASDLTRALQTHLAVKTPSDIVEIFNHAPPADFASFAPLVIEAAGIDDPIALKIVQEGADYLSRLALRALSVGDNRLALVGGVTAEILPWLNEVVLNVVYKAQHGPERGALFYQDCVSKPF